jgi:hypothetical protein
MPLLETEIVPGAVAILDGAVLQADANVTSPDHQGQIRSGPFLCIQVKDGKSVWLHITRQPKGNLRLPLDPAWRVDGSPIWKTDPQYINDARKPFTGPNQSFVKAAARELPHQPHSRPKISAVGVAASVAEVEKYGAALL